MEETSLQVRLHCCMWYMQLDAVPVHSNYSQSIAGRRKPCVDKIIVACLFEGGPGVLRVGLLVCCQKTSKTLDMG